MRTENQKMELGDGPRRRTFYIGERAPSLQSGSDRGVRNLPCAFSQSDALAMRHPALRTWAISGRGIYRAKGALRAYLLYLIETHLIVFLCVLPTDRLLGAQSRPFLLDISCSARSIIEPSRNGTSGASSARPCCGSKVCFWKKSRPLRRAFAKLLHGRRRLCGIRVLLPCRVPRGTWPPASHPRFT